MTVTFLMFPSFGTSALPEPGGPDVGQCIVCSISVLVGAGATRFLVQVRQRPYRKPESPGSRPKLEQGLPEPFVPLRKVKVQHFVGFGLAANASDQRVFFVALPGAKAEN